MTSAFIRLVAGIKNIARSIRNIAKYKKTMINESDS